MASEICGAGVRRRPEGFEALRYANGPRIVHGVGAALHCRWPETFVVVQLCRWPRKFVALQYADGLAFSADGQRGLGHCNMKMARNDLWRQCPDGQ